MYSGTRNDTRVTTAIHFYVWPYTFPQGLLKCSEIIRGVMGPCNANGTMLRQCDQLILVAENHHFEGGPHLKAKE